MRRILHQITYHQRTDEISTEAPRQKTSHLPYGTSNLKPVLFCKNNQHSVILRNTRPRVKSLFHVNSNYQQPTATEPKETLHAPGTGWQGCRCGGDDDARITTNMFAMTSVRPTSLILLAIHPHSDTRLNDKRRQKKPDAILLETLCRIDHHQS